MKTSAAAFGVLDLALGWKKRKSSARPGVPGAVRLM
jgi:hypothetical protein